MSGLGLLATAFGSYASTLGGLYKEQVDKEQAAQEKLAAEERGFMRQLALKDIDERYKKAAEDRQREWERQKTAEERTFAIDMLQRKFEQNVQLTGYEHKLKLEEQESALRNKQRLIDYTAQAARRDALARRMIEQGGGTETDPKNTKLVVDALTKQLDTIGKMIENARPEERQRWLDQYHAVQQKLNNLLGLGNDEGPLFRDPNDIINSLANE